ncbi:hypothetical protein Bca4012_039699 [Brassica carinata]
MNYLKRCSFCCLIKRRLLKDMRHMPLNFNRRRRFPTLDDCGLLSSLETCGIFEAVPAPPSPSAIPLPFLSSHGDVLCRFRWQQQKIRTPPAVPPAMISIRFALLFFSDGVDAGFADDGAGEIPHRIEQKIDFRESEALPVLDELLNHIDVSVSIKCLTLGFVTRPILDLFPAVLLPTRPTQIIAKSLSFSIVDLTFNHQDWDSKLQQTMVEMFPLRSADAAYGKIKSMRSTLGDPFTRIISLKILFTNHLHSDIRLLRTIMTPSKALTVAGGRYFCKDPRLC